MILLRKARHDLTEVLLRCCKMNTSDSWIMMLNKDLFLGNNDSVCLEEM